jgi:hypothetical protein
LDEVESSLGGMKMTIGRLKRSEGWKAVGVRGESSVNNSFKDFGDEVQVGDRSVAGEIVLW